MADKKILLVDDEIIEAMNIKRTLESFGYTVPYIASRGEEAIMKALEIMPDLILMDIILKGEIDGIEAASKIKELDIPVIFLTAHSEEFTIQKVKPTEPYIIKPYDRNELKYAIKLAIRNNMEKKLKASESKYDSLFENMLNGFAYNQIIIDDNNHPVDYVFIRINKAFEKLTGLKRDNIIGKLATEIIPELKTTNPELIELLGQVALTGESKIIELYFPPLKKFFSITAYSEEKGYFAAIFEDITQRRLADKALKESEKKYRAIFENSGTAIMTFKREGTIIMINSESERLSGYSREEVEGKMKWMDFVHPDYLEKMTEYIQRRLKDPESAPYKYETVFIKKSGDLRVLYITLSSLPGPDIFLASALNITDLQNTQKIGKKTF